MLKGRLAAAFLVLILLPYVAFSSIILTSPAPSEDALTSSSVHASCPSLGSPGTGAVLQVYNQTFPHIPPPAPHGWYRNISSAYAHARPGDVIVVYSGTYHESVVISKPCISILGTDRSTVVLDGRNTLDNGFAVYAPGVSIDDLTVKNYVQNGVYYEQANDWYVGRVNTLNNGHYGIYAVASTFGKMDDDFAMGNGDSGFYVGAVSDCRCEIVNSTAYGNVLGYSGTRANGVTIRDSRFINNSVGIGPNTLLPDFSAILAGNWKIPLFATNHTIVNNLIENNNNNTVAGVGISQTYGVPIGTGLFMLGVSGSTVANNTISGNKLWGVAQFTFFNLPTGNTYMSDRFSRNGQDYFSDGTGFFGCSSGEQASGNAPLPCSLPAWTRLTVPNPYNELVLIFSVGKPGLTNHLTAILPVVALLAVSAGAASMGSATPSRKRRIGSAVLDLLVAGDVYLIALSFVVIAGFGASTLSDVAFYVASLTLLLSPLAYLLVVTSWFFYGLGMEAIAGRTVGQWLIGLRVVGRSGGKPGVVRILLKNLLLYVDTLLFGAVGLMAVFFRRRTVGELLSRTRLVASEDSQG